ncbi:MAG: sensor histidine kinase [Candidatus Electrothrix sp. GM3_4]|nr:sensor histidine kinase [Candidatus Electrothrix sp. GM3_4]
MSTRERPFGLICSNFYSSLKTGSATKICPFGFEVLYLKIQVGQQYLILYGLISHDKEIFSRKVHPLPRETKKKAKIEIDKKTISFDIDDTYKFFALTSDVLNTLLAGRVGASIRSLSHHILTPIQGAMADIDIIEIKNTSETEFNRLKKNISEINDTSKTIQLLLAEQLQFNKNQIRRTTIHHYVKKIILSLESSAQKERIDFKQGFNNASTSIEAIPDQLFIVLQNLIQNAFKYSHKGFCDKKNIIHIDYEMFNNKYLGIKISNIGCGITEREIKSKEIFDLGFRGELSNDRERTGSGWGAFPNS